MFYEKYIKNEREDNNYYYQQYSFDLNNIIEELRKALSSMNSSFKHEHRIMEKQDIDKAEEEQLKLEEKQKKKRK